MNVGENPVWERPVTANVENRGYQKSRREKSNQPITNNEIQRTNERCVRKRRVVKSNVDKQTNGSGR